MYMLAPFCQTAPFGIVNQVVEFGERSENETVMTSSFPLW